jgi:hypothetical protein
MNVEGEKNCEEGEKAEMNEENIYKINDDLFRSCSTRFSPHFAHTKFYNSRDIS